MKKLMTALFMLSILTGLPTAYAQANTNDVINGMNDFAFASYRSLSQANQNMIYSPYSLSYLLEILVNGAALGTQSQLRDLLHLANYPNLANLNASLDQINTDLLANNQGLNLANALWADKTVSYHPDFIASMDKLHNKNFYQVDFKHDANAARLTINNWAATNTGGYIKGLLAKSDVTSLTRLILTNAIYFKGAWMLPFNKANTMPGAFSTADAKTVQTPMMHLTSSEFRYAEDDQVQILSMNYKQSSLAMAIILPKDKNKFQQIKQTLDISKLTMLDAMQEHAKYIVTIPKFKLNSTFASLVSSLRGLGLKDAFDPGKANFSKMVNSDPSSSFYISNIIQKALVEVDEAGTIAAASTAVVISARAVMISPVNQRNIIFTADHAFIFLIYDTQTKLILFIGQVTAPGEIHG